MVVPGVESRSFQIRRGVRQGAPLSPLLFNMVLNRVLDEVRTTCKNKGYGPNVGLTLRGERLTRVAFADDMTPVARSWLPMKRMLSMPREALGRRGLTLHPSKCQLQTNDVRWHQRSEIVI